jgi:broad-specificity NMP kinase
LKGWVIIVCGVAAVGKTLFSLKLAEKLGVEFIDLPNLVKEMKLYEYYDEASEGVCSGF